MENIDYMNFEGFNIIQASKNEWFLQLPGQIAWMGSLREVVLMATLRFEFDKDEIIVALEDMIITGKNAAHFGQFGSFMYCFTQDLTPIRKAS